MRNLILAVLLIGLSVNVYADDKDPTKTGVTETECKYNKDHLARNATPASNEDTENKKPAAIVIDKE